MAQSPGKISDGQSSVAAMDLRSFRKRTYTYNIRKQKTRIMAASNAESERIDPNEYVKLLTAAQTGAFVHSDPCVMPEIACVVVNLYRFTDLTAHSLAALRLGGKLVRAQSATPRRKNVLVTQNRADILEAQISIAENGLRRIRELSAEKLRTPTWTSPDRATAFADTNREVDETELGDQRLELQSILENWLQRFSQVLAIASKHKDIRESSEFQNHTQTTRALLRQGHNILTTVNRRKSIPIRSDPKCRRIMKQIANAIDLFGQTVQREAAQSATQLSHHAGLATMMDKNHASVRRTLRRCLYSRNRVFPVCSAALSVFEHRLSELQRIVRAGAAQHLMQTVETETAAAVAEFEIVRLISVALEQLFEAEDRLKLLKQLFAENWNSSQAETLTENIERISHHLDWMSELLEAFPTEAQLRSSRQEAFTQANPQDQIASYGALRPFVGCTVRAGKDWPRAELPLGRRGGEVLSSGALRRSGLVTKVRVMDREDGDDTALVCTVNWRGELESHANSNADGDEGGEADADRHRYAWHPGHCFEICVDEHVTDWSGGDGSELREHDIDVDGWAETAKRFRPSWMAGPALPRLIGVRSPAQPAWLGALVRNREGDISVGKRPLGFVCDVADLEHGWIRVKWDTSLPEGLEMDPAQEPLQQEMLCRWGVGGVYDADLVLALGTTVSLGASHKLISIKGYKQFEGNVGRVVSVDPQSPADGGRMSGVPFITCGMATVEWDVSMTRTHCRWGIESSASGRSLERKNSLKSTVSAAARTADRGKITVTFSERDSRKQLQSAFADGGESDPRDGGTSMFGRREAFGSSKSESKRDVTSATRSEAGTVDIDWEGSGYGNVQERTSTAMSLLPKIVYDVNIILYPERIQYRADMLVRAELHGETRKLALAQPLDMESQRRTRRPFGQSVNGCNLPPVDGHKLVYTALWTQMQLSMQSCHHQLMKRTDKELQRYFAQRYADTVTTLRKSSINTVYRSYRELLPGLMDGLRDRSILIAPSVTCECALRMLEAEAARTTCLEVLEKPPPRGISTQRKFTEATSALSAAVHGWSDRVVACTRALRTVIETGSAARKSTASPSTADQLLRMLPVDLSRYSLIPPAAHGSQFDLRSLAKRYEFTLKDNDGFESDGDEYDDESYDDFTDGDEDVVSLDMRERWEEALSRVRCEHVVECGQTCDHSRDMWRGMDSLFKGLIDQIAQALHEIVHAREATKEGSGHTPIGSMPSHVAVLRPQLSKMDHEIVKSIRALLETLKRVHATSRCLDGLTSPSTFSLAQAFTDCWLQNIELKLFNAKAHIKTMTEAVAARMQAVKGEHVHKRAARKPGGATSSKPVRPGSKLKYVIPDRQHLITARTNLAQTLAQVSVFDSGTVLQDARQKCSSVLKCADTTDKIDAGAYEQTDVELWMRQQVLLLIAKATTKNYLAPCFDVVSTLSQVAQRDSIPRVKSKLRAVKEAIQRSVKHFWGPRHRSTGLGNDLDVIDLLCTASDLRGQVQVLLLDFRDSLAEIAKYRRGIARLNSIKADIQERVHKATALAGAVVISNQDVARAHADLKTQLELLADESYLARVSQDKSLRDALLGIAHKMNRKAGILILLVLASSVDCDNRAKYASELVLANRVVQIQMRTIRDSAEDAPATYDDKTEVHVRDLCVVGEVLRRKVQTHGLYSKVAKAQLRKYDTADATLPTVRELIASCSAELSKDQHDHDTIEAALKRFMHDVASAERYLELQHFAYTLRKRVSQSKRSFKERWQVVVEVEVNKDPRVRTAFGDLKKALARSKKAIKQVALTASSARSTFRSVFKELAEAHKALLKTDADMSVTVATIVQEKRDRIAAATMIANMYRSFVARRAVKERKRIRDEHRRVVAAAKLGKWCTSTLSRLRAWYELEKKKAASALDIQRVWRGYKSRKRIACLRRMKKVPLIQSLWRGYHARQKFKKLKAETILHRFFFRSLIRLRARKKIRARVEKRSARVLQRAVRRYLARMEELRQLNRKVEKFRRNYAAKVIQRKLVRPYLRRAKMATRMQSQIRGFLRRKTNEQWIAAAYHLQRTMRMRLLTARAPSAKKRAAPHFWQYPLAVRPLDQYRRAALWLQSHSRRLRDQKLLKDLSSLSQSITFEPGQRVLVTGEKAQNLSNQFWVLRTPLRPEDAVEKTAGDNDLALRTKLCEVAFYTSEADLGRRMQTLQVEIHRLRPVFFKHERVRVFISKFGHKTTSEGDSDAETWHDGIIVATPQGSEGGYTVLLHAKSAGGQVTEIKHVHPLQMVRRPRQSEGKPQLSVGQTVHVDLQRLLHHRLITEFKDRITSILNDNRDNLGNPEKELDRFYQRDGVMLMEAFLERWHARLRERRPRTAVATIKTTEPEFLLHHVLLEEAGTDSIKNFRLDAFESLGNERAKAVRAKPNEVDAGVSVPEHLLYRVKHPNTMVLLSDEECETAVYQMKNKKFSAFKKNCAKIVSRSSKDLTYIIEHVVGHEKRENVQVMRMHEAFMAGRVVKYSSDSGGIKERAKMVKPIACRIAVVAKVRSFFTYDVHFSNGEHKDGVPFTCLTALGAPSSFMIGHDAQLRTAKDGRVLECVIAGKHTVDLSENTYEFTRYDVFYMDNTVEENVTPSLLESVYEKGSTVNYWDTPRDVNCVEGTVVAMDAHGCYLVQTDTTLHSNCHPMCLSLRHEVGQAVEVYNDDDTNPKWFRGSVQEIHTAAQELVVRIFCDLHQYPEGMITRPMRCVTAAKYSVCEWLLPNDVVCFTEEKDFQKIFQDSPDVVWNRGWITKLVDSKTEDGGTKVLVQRSSDTDDSTDFSADVEIECEIFQVRFLYEKDAQVHVPVGYDFTRAKEGDPILRKAVVSFVHPDGKCDVEYESFSGEDEQVSEKRVHCALIRTVFAEGERVCQAAGDTTMQVGSVGSVIKVHEGTGRYSVNFGEDANGRGGVQEVHAMDIRRLRPDDYKFVFAAAVRSNNEEEVLDLIGFKANLNATDQDPQSEFYGLSPLSIAAYNGNQSMARLLLEHKANVNSQDTPDGATPLIFAASQGHHETAELLCEQDHVDLEAYTTGKDDNNSFTALGCSCSNGKSEVLKVLLDKKADVNAPIHNATGKTTGLREAARAGHLDVIKLLLDAKAPVDGSGDKGTDYPPLCDAASTGQVDAVKLLLDCKADAWLRSEDGASAIVLALQNAHLDVFQNLLERPDFPASEYLDLIAETLKQKDGADIKFLSSALDRASTLDPHIDLNQPKSKGESTVLTTAVMCGSSNEHIELLLDHKVDVNGAQNDDGTTALMLAATAGDPRVVESLLRHKASLAVRNADNHDALFFGAANGMIESVRLLLETDAEPSDHSSEAVIAAAANQHDEVVALLLKSKASASASVSDHPDVVAALDRLSTASKESDAHLVAAERDNDIKAHDSDGDSDNDFASPVDVADNGASGGNNSPTDDDKLQWSTAGDESVSELQDGVVDSAEEPQWSIEMGESASELQDSVVDSAVLDSAVDEGTGNVSEEQPEPMSVNDVPQEAEASEEDEYEVDGRDYDGEMVSPDEYSDEDGVYLSESNDENGSAGDYDGYEDSVGDEENNASFDDEEV